MRILYDYQDLTFQRYGGIATYFCSIIPRIAKTETVILGLKWTRCIQAYGWDGLYGGKIGEQIERIIAGFRHGRYLASTLWRHTVLLINVCYFLRLLLRQRFDVVHVTLDVRPWWIPILRRPFVLTVHDLIPKMFFERTSHVCHYLQRRKELAHKASRLIAVSQNTKNDAVRIWGVSPEKIDVVYHGPTVQPGREGRWASFGPYILYVGGRGLYKNFIWFLKAIAPVLREHKGMKLVCTGSPFTTAERKVMGMLGIADFCVDCYVPDDEMYSLYHHAQVFVYPSKYEGFGIPILDAFTAGCPVVLSRASCFPEVAGNAAVYFALDDETGFRQAVLGIISTKVLRAECIERGLRRVLDFSWDKAARQTITSYRHLMVTRSLCLILLLVQISSGCYSLGPFR